MTSVRSKIGVDRVDQAESGDTNDLSRDADVACQPQPPPPAPLPSPCHFLADVAVMQTPPMTTRTTKTSSSATSSSHADSTDDSHDTHGIHYEDTPRIGGVLPDAAKSVGGVSAMTDSSKNYVPIVELTLDPIPEPGVASGSFVTGTTRESNLTLTDDER